MAAPLKRMIIAADFGGTKGELLLVDAESGGILRHTIDDFRDMPPEIAGKADGSRGGLGRSIEMGNYCLGKALRGLRPEEAVIVYTGLTFNEARLGDMGIKYLGRFLLHEENGIMAAEECREGICAILGTGATARIFMEGRDEFIIDARGPVCGDWGGGYYIGCNFVKNVLREQNFTEDILPETNKILAFLRECSGLKPETSFVPEKHITPSWEIVAILLEKNNRSYVASLARLCDSCARNGSRLAREVLENAGKEAASNVCRGAQFTGICRMERIPVIASGSVLLKSDIVYDSFRRNVSQGLPNSEIRRSSRRQTYGQTLIMLRKLYGEEGALPRIARFKADSEDLESRLQQ